MFDWNGNGKHDAFDDFVTFGLLEDLINEEEEKRCPQECNNNLLACFRIDYSNCRFYSDNLQYQKSTSDSAFYIRFSIYQLYCNVTGI